MKFQTLLLAFLLPLLATKLHAQTVSDLTVIQTLDLTLTDKLYVTDVEATGADKDRAATLSQLVTLFGPSIVVNGSNITSGTIPNARLDSDLASIGDGGTTSYGRSLLNVANEAGLRSLAGLGTLATQNGTLTDYAPRANPTFTGTITGAALSLSGNISVTGNISTGSGLISGNGSGITSLNASNITSGSLAMARLATDPLARTNHTGTQAISSVSGLQAALDAKEPTQTAASQAEAEAGTETATRSFSPLRIKQAITALAGTSTTSPYPTPNVYVDSTAGHDGNNGLTESTPKATLAAALAIAPSTNAVIGLKTGGYWRESLNLSSLTTPTVTRYGSGTTAPIIDGTNVFETGWSKTSGQTNLYQVSVTHDATGTNRLTVYENGTLLARVTSNAACDALAGSFVDVKGSDGATVTVKIHATTVDKNPLTNGNLYEITTRTVAFTGPNNTTAIGIRTQRCCNNNGGFDLVAKDNGLAKRILSHWGTKHNLGMGSGDVEDCVSLYSDVTTSYEPSNTTGVAFMNDGTGKSYHWKRFGAVDTKGVDFLSHGSPTGFDSGFLTQCWTINVPPNPCRTLNKGCYYKNTNTIPRQQLSMCMVDAGSGFGSAMGEALAFRVDNTVADTVIKRTSSGFEFWRNNGGILQNCVHVCGTDFNTWFSNGVADLLTVNRTIFFGGPNYIILPSGSTYAGNYNVFYAPGGTLYFNKGTGLRTGLAAWQTETGQDAQSVYIVAADQTIGNPYAFWLGRRLSRNLGAWDGDCRINPNARVYNSAGTAFIGTFPDGTAITFAGPRNYWNWSTRAEASGPPSRFQDVPDTLSESETYVADPAKWNFYP
jgi:hypothetical protein